MRTQPVDERDSTWESTETRYRVYLFGARQSAPLDLDQGGQPTETIDVWDADLLDVLRLAQEHAGPHRLWALALVETDEQGRYGLRWLTGRDYNSRPRDDRERQAHQTMRARLGRTPVTG